MSPPFESETIYIAGHNGMVGSAIYRLLEKAGHQNLIGLSSSELDLRNQAAVSSFFASHKPSVVVVAAAKVGGIYANKTYPAEFIYDNLQIGTQLIHAAHEHGVKRLLFLGSSCIYPKDAPLPIPEDALFSGKLESTNEAYAIAKIASLKMCQFYRQQYGDLFHSVMPCNLYGPGDNYHPENSHVIPGLIRRIHEAKERGDASVTIWGTGKPRREFLYVDDLAKACVHLLGLENPPDLINVGSGSEITILELARLISQIIGFEGEIECDTEKPDGVLSKLMDSKRIFESGWRPSTDLEEGLRITYGEFLREER